MLYQVAVSLTQELQGLGRRAYVTFDPWDLRGQILHFGDRYALLDGPYQNLHPTNKIFMTWHHGDPTDPSPDIQRVFQQLPTVLPRLEKIIVSCEITRQHLLDFGIPDAHLVTIPIGFNLERFHPPTPAERATMRAELGIPDEAFCIGSFQKDGQGWGDGMEPKLIKGPDVFLETLSHLRQRQPELFVLLTGPARGYVKAGLAALGIPYVHHFLEDYHAIPRFYHALDAYIIASRVEGGPIALLESWASGVPLISTRMGMAADLIRSGENGLLADVEDSLGLANHTEQVIQAPALRERLRQQALVDVQGYSWGMVAQQYNRLLYAPLLDA